MKKTKAYFIFPIIALLLFAGYYWNFSATYKAHQDEIVAAAKARAQERLKQQAEASEKAVNDAVEAQKRHKADRLAKEALERKQRDDKENAILVAEKADQESQKLQRQVEKLTHDIATEKKDIADIQADDAKQVSEIAFLTDYVKAADAHRAELGTVLTKIQAADEAEARAKALADAEAKKKSE